MNTNLESIIPLLNKNLKIIQRSDYFNFSIDSLLISEFVNIQKNTKKILDLGTGNAAIPLFLSKKTSAKIYGIEIQEISYELALRNININNLNEQIYIIYDNMKNYSNHFNMGAFDIVISNLSPRSVKKVQNQAISGRMGDFSLRFPSLQNQHYSGFTLNQYGVASP